jgi:hypothetical protein
MSPNQGYAAMATRLMLELMDWETVLTCLKCGMVISRPPNTSNRCAQCGTDVVGHATLDLADLESLTASMKALCTQAGGGNYRIRLQVAGSAVS